MKKCFCDRCGRGIEPPLNATEELVENFRVGIEILLHDGRTAPELCSACILALAAIAGNRGSPDPLANRKPSSALLDVEG